MQTLRFGIDLGGTKTELVALRVDGSVAYRQRQPTPAHSYSDILQLIRTMIQRAERELNCRAAVGIGIPGSPNRQGIIRNANTRVLNGTHLQADLQTLLQRPVRIRNDADCFTLSEASDGAAAGAATVFGVIIGTGTGGGIALNGQLLQGANGIAGEWGHNPLPWPQPGEGRDGPACFCGRHSCIETFLSGPGFSARHAADGGRHGAAPDIVQRALTGDAAASLSLERYCERMARALAHIINVLDPDVIVLGGGMSNIDALYQRVPALWQPWIFSDSVCTRLVRAHHGDSSGVRGAAWLWHSAELNTAAPT